MIELNWFDAHCHFFELDEKGVLDKELNAAEEVGGFFCSALSKEQFDWYITNDKKYPIKWYAGIHPYYDKSDIKDLDKIISLAQDKKIIGIGEIGLDKRGNDKEHQKEILLKQLDIATQFDLPVVFHVVGKYYELYKILKKNFPKIRGILHGFGGSQEIFEMFKKFDLAFSIGNKFDNDNLMKEIIKYGFFTVETDAPYQKPKGSDDDYNHLSNLGLIIKKMEKFTNSAKEIQYKSIKKIFNL